MPRKSITITKADHDCLDDLILSTVGDALHDRPHLEELRSELAVAQIVHSDKVPVDVVTMNSTFKVCDLKTKQTDTLTLVYPQDANFTQGKLSILAPLGTAILGYRVGDLVQCQLPSGIGRWRVLELVFQPEREIAAAQFSPR